MKHQKILDAIAQVREQGVDESQASPRYQIPRAPAFAVRTRLLQGLEELRRGVWMVLAGPGYGKTSLLSSWANQRNEPVAWLSATTQEQEMGHFLRSLETALDNAGVQAKLAQLGEDNVSLVADRLSGRFNGMPPFTLVIDNAHLLGQGPTARLLEEMIEQLPDSLHLVLLTTAQPRSRTWFRFHLYGRAQVLGVETLLFRPDEVAQELGLPERTQRRRGGDSSDQAVNEIMEGSGGWPVAVDTLCRARRGPEGSGLEDYLAEVWGDLGQLDTELLLRCSPFQVVGEEFAEMGLGLDLAQDSF